MAVVFGGTVTSSVTFFPSRRHAVVIGPLGPFTDAFAHMSASMNCGAITTSRSAVADTSGIAAQLPAFSGSWMPPRYWYAHEARASWDS